MASGLVTIIRKLAALAVLAGVLYLAVDHGRAADVQAAPPAQDPPYPTNTIAPMPTAYPTAEDTQVPPTFEGPTPTQVQAATTSPTTRATPRTTLTAGPTQRLTASVLPTLPTALAPTRTQDLGPTATLEPLPSLDLLFPNLLPQTPTPTLSLTEQARQASGGTSFISNMPPLVSTLGVLVVVIWGLLGVFLVTYLKRLGY